MATISNSLGVPVENQPKRINACGNYLLGIDISWAVMGLMASLGRSGGRCPYICTVASVVPRPK